MNRYWSSHKAEALAEAEKSERTDIQPAEAWQRKKDDEETQSKTKKPEPTAAAAAAAAAATSVHFLIHARCVLTCMNHNAV